jgi:hypothetical protein
MVYKATSIGGLMAQTFDIRYRFLFSNHREEIVAVKIDKHSLESTADEEPPPAWCKLDFHQCPNCPLQTATTPYCPLATRLVRLVIILQGVVSFDEVDIEVTTPERVITGHTTAQRAASSLMGLIMATSGCPHMEFLKPMARFHLPLATEEETIFRSVSSYLLTQYFRQRHQQGTDFTLDRLKHNYTELRKINMAMSIRLRTISEQDSAINALILLDLFAKTLPDSIDDSLDLIHYLFVSD